MPWTPPPGPTPVEDVLIGLRSLIAGQAGIPASIDRESAEAPGCLIEADTLTLDVTLTEPGQRTGTLRCNVYLLSPDLRPAASLHIRAGLLARLLTVLDPDAPIDTSYAVSITAYDHPLPAFRVPVDMPYQED